MSYLLLVDVLLGSGGRDLADCEGGHGRAPENERNPGLVIGLVPIRILLKGALISWHDAETFAAQPLWKLSCEQETCDARWSYPTP